MLVSYKWLQEYFEKPLLNAQELCDLISLRAFEIEDCVARGDDWIIDVDVLPNRAHDCLSHDGIAREISTITQIPLKKRPVLTTHATVEGNFSVSVETELCRRYIGREITNIRVGESAPELRAKLESIGQRSINNIVDITNVVMFMTGQPMHAFDADKISGEIVVRRANEGQEIITLDNKQVKLNMDAVVIYDKDTPLAIAGIKGGKHAEVDNATTRIILEAANFSPTYVRKVSRKINVMTDSSKRFENEITPILADRAMDIATELILKYAATDATTVSLKNDTYPNYEKWHAHSVSVTAQHINDLLGTDFTAKEISSAFDRLGFEYETAGQNSDTFTLSIPVERLDIQSEHDVIEEVGRVLGLERVSEKPLAEMDFAPAQNKMYAVSQKIKSALNDLGFSEVYTYTFVPTGVIAPENPISEDKAFLRTTLEHGITTTLEKNLRNVDFLMVDQVCVFEIGKVFPKKGEERVMLGIGVANRNGFKKPKASQTITEALAKISEVLGVPVTAKISDTTTFVEINLEKVVATVGDISYVPLTPIPTNKYVSISAYPFMIRDVAVWVPDAVAEADVLALIVKNAGPLMIKNRLFDVFKKDGRTSYAFRLVFQSFEKTLTDAEVNAIMDGIAGEMKKSGWEVR